MYRLKLSDLSHLTWTRNMSLRSTGERVVRSIPGLGRSFVPRPQQRIPRLELQKTAKPDLAKTSNLDLSNLSVQLITRDELDAPTVERFASQACLNTLVSLERQAYIRKLLSSPTLLAVVSIELGGRYLVKAALWGSQIASDRAYLGCYEAAEIPERQSLVQKLLQRVTQHAQTLGIKKIYGPIDGCTWYGYRIRVDQHERTFAWEPKHNPSLLADWTAAGFSVDSHYRSFGSHMIQLGTLYTSLSYIRAHLRGLHFEPMSQVWQDNLSDLHRIIHSSFTNNHLFEPLDFASFSGLYGKLDERFDLSSSRFLVNAKGQRVGFSLSYYDQGYLVIKSIAIAKDYQGLGLGRSLLCASARAAMQAGYQRVVGALVRSGIASDSISMAFTRIGIMNWLHSYRLLAFRVPSQS